MKLVYKVLWIDDNQVFFKNHESVISEHLEDKGFVCDITKYTSISEFEDKEASSEHQKLYDLFLIDLNLDNDDTGDQIINNIRENTLVDIIFYSTVLDNVRKSVSENNIEGVYITSRNKDDFEEKVTDVIDVTIRKVQDVNNLRGLIMAEVAELDRIKKEIIKKFTQNNPDHNELKKYIRDSVFKKFNNDKNTFYHLSANDETYININVEELVDNLIYDSYKKARTVQKIADNEFTLKDYNQDIIKKRNVLAHEKEKIRENGTHFFFYFDGTELEFSENQCIKIRKDIQKYKKIAAKL
ncbi:hypothetical protein CRYPA_1985 [uncultured Candidatus Thioglobus sp.]|nr:hypothetical protein CRYPA_1985 [uncultured Candidatus Thioglobus sp.]